MGALTWSCKYDDDDIWKAVDDLENRVVVMENAVKQINTDIASLRTIVEALQADVTIKSVVEGDEGCTITFSNGKSVVITNGKDGADAPKISVVKDEDGYYYWALDGKIMEVDGVKIKAQGVDGVTPQLRINEETKMWEYSLDGETWISMNVNAGGIFKSVTDGEENVTFELTDGSKIVLPKGSGSVFRFVLKDGCTSELFSFGEEKEIQLSVVNMAEADYMNIPSGWSVKYDLEKKVAVVQAPELGSAQYTGGIISLIGIDKKGETLIASAKVCAVNFSDPKGAYVLNEGNMTSENGSLIFISSTGDIVDKAYYGVNGTELGNVTQDLFVSDGKMYIIAQNGNRMGGDGMLVVADMATLKKVKTYSNDDLGLTWPSHIAVVGDLAYIRDNNGVHALNLATGAISLIEGSSSAAYNRMAVAGGKVFVPAGKNILVLQDGAVVKTIEFEKTVSGVVKSSDNNVWVSCTTTPAQIIKMNASDYTMVSHELPDGYKVGAGWGATPGITAKENSIYFCNAGSVISRHDFEANTTTTLTDVKSHIANFGMLYNNPAVHPVTGNLYYTSIKGYGMNFLINDIAVFDFSGTSPLLVKDYQNYTHFPAGIFFVADFQ